MEVTLPTSELDALEAKRAGAKVCAVGEVLERLLPAARMRAGYYTPGYRDSVDPYPTLEPHAGRAVARGQAVEAFLRWRLKGSEYAFQRRIALDTAREAARLDPLWAPLVEVIEQQLNPQPIRRHVLGQESSFRISPGRLPREDLATPGYVRTPEGEILAVQQAPGEETLGYARTRDAQGLVCGIEPVRLRVHGLTLTTRPGPMEPLTHYGLTCRGCDRRAGIQWGGEPGEAYTQLLAHFRALSCPAAEIL